MKKTIDILKERAIYVVLLVMIIFFSVANKNFLTVNNLLNIAKQEIGRASCRERV